MGTTSRQPGSLTTVRREPLQMSGFSAQAARGRTNTNTGVYSSRTGWYVGCHSFTPQLEAMMHAHVQNKFPITSGMI